MSNQIDRTQKYAIEMNYEEFINWATGYILFGIGEGRRLHDLVSLIINQAAMNQVFGGSKKK